MTRARSWLALALVIRRSDSLAGVTGIRHRRDRLIRGRRRRESKNNNENRGNDKGSKNNEFGVRVAIPFQPKPVGVLCAYEDVALVKDESGLGSTRTQRRRAERRRALNAM